LYIYLPPFNQNCHSKHPINLHHALRRHTVIYDPNTAGRIQLLPHLNATTVLHFLMRVRSCIYYRLFCVCAL